MSFIDALTGLKKLRQEILPGKHCPVFMYDRAVTAFKQGMEGKKVNIPVPGKSNA